MTPKISTPNIQKFRDEAFSNEYLTKLIGVDANCTDLEFIQSVMNSDMDGAIGYKDRLSKYVIEHVVVELDKVN